MVILSLFRIIRSRRILQQALVVIGYPEVTVIAVAFAAPAVAHKPGAVARRRAVAEIRRGEVVVPADKHDGMVAAAFIGAIVGVVRIAVVLACGIKARTDAAVCQDGVFDRAPVLRIVGIGVHEPYAAVGAAGVGRRRIVRRPFVGDCGFQNGADHACQRPDGPAVACA